MARVIDLKEICIFKIPKSWLSVDETEYIIGMAFMSVWWINVLEIYIPYLYFSFSKTV